MSGQLKEVRDRIGSVKSTEQITKAMKMVSASKLRRAQMAITEMRPYADKLDEMLTNILSNLEGKATSEYSEERAVSNVAIVVVSSSKGLCGAFNANIMKAAIKLMEEKYAAELEAGNVTLFCLGKKCNEYFTKYYPKANVVSDYADIFTGLSFEKTSEVSQRLMDTFLEKGYDKVDVCYTVFKNTITQIPTTVQFLPVETIEPEVETEGFVEAKTDYLFEPGKQELLDELIPSILHTTFQKYILDTHASEHGARMTAMDNATENAKELIKELKISYNKARQEAVTREISEIVGGAAALGG